MPLELESALGRQCGRQSARFIVNQARQRHPFASLEYGRAFGSGVEVIDVPAWSSAVVARAIPNTDLRDATGCYPFVPLQRDGDLAAGLNSLRAHDLISIVLVTDPLRMPPVPDLEEHFDFCRAFKTHYVFDRSIGPINMSRRHWREVRIARRELQIREVIYADHVDRFAELYSNLIENHHIEGIAAFDAVFFRSLVDVPGIRTIAAFLDDDIVSIMMFVVDGDVAYAFLAGTSEEGRERCAHYGLYAEAIEHFTDVSVINLGGAPGVIDDPNHGIAYVKRKLTNTTLRSYLCGAVLDADAYVALGGNSNDYFPAYRGVAHQASGDPK
ncbi:hypothetical protein J2W51_003708 [Tardiphaga robiniae]|uniref:GNAT family N-acetyltransferase n=1 Tax=Tardiphaga robiniae TaxID=943830 RepID=UPI002863708F|nr:GNAT family N-acetyltransferase [Tardiphaga robiniae]MDR6661122.1 hypothetical protein [Tardiphaga robiniae]